LAGAKIENSEKLDGKAIWSDFIAGTNPRPDDIIFALRHNKGYSSASARQNDWKAVRASEGPWQLFNVVNDISERNDLSKTHPEKLADLVNRTRSWCDTHTEPDWFDSLKVAENWNREEMPHYDVLLKTGLDQTRSKATSSIARPRSDVKTSTPISDTESNLIDSAKGVEFYSEDFSTPPEYVIARGPNDNNISSISFGTGSEATDVPSVKFGQFAGTGQYLSDVETLASLSNGKFTLGSNKSVFEKSRNRSYVTFVDTAAAKMGQYNIAFDVSDFQDDSQTGLYLHLYEGSHADKGYFDMQLTHQAMLPKLAPGRPTIKGHGARIESILLDNQIEGNGKFNLNFGLSYAGKPGHFLAIVWSQVKRNGNSKMPSMSIDNLKVTRLESDATLTESKSTELPVGQIGAWKLLEDFSDEFDGASVNPEKWNSNPRRYGALTWDDKNVVVKDGILNLNLTYAPHFRDNQKLFYKSGMLRSHRQMTYGYFESRIKGCSLFPGACPAFWIFSDGRKYDGEVRYCEVDVAELQMNELDHESGTRHPVNYIDMNLHHRLADADGTLRWVRPNTDPEICKNLWKAPWDPRDDFHVYGCDVTPETITWYIDGEKVAEKPNRYCHLPMNVALTLELRHPHIGWQGYNIFPVPKAATEEGFPTTMEVDYVRVWERSK
jgi:beta-glucanase (GH16 family)